MPPYPSLALVNGRIYTGDSRNPWAEAVCCVDNRIVYVGRTAEAKNYLLPRGELLDAQGALVLPGFIDAHAHTIMGGTSLLSVDLSRVRNQREFVETMRSYIAAHRGAWVTGGNWNHENWETRELPRKEWIDDFTSDTPVFVSRMDYHMALANSAALRVANITRDTPDPPGGLIVRDPHTAEPTGILKDAAYELVQRARPDQSEEERLAAANAALNEAAQCGVTSIHDICDKNDLRTLQQLDRMDKLTCRFYARLPIAEHEGLIRNDIEAGFGSDRLAIGSVKAFADGSLGSATALFFEPYTDNPSSTGLAMDILMDGRLRKWALECDRQRLQLSIHAIGDKANALMLDLFEEILSTNPAWDRRFRIEHAQHLRPGDFARFARLGVIVSAQPYHLYEDGPWAERLIGPERLRGMYAFASFLKAGAMLCFGSDWPVVTLNPLAGIYAAVTRQTGGGGHPGGLIPGEKISVKQAVRCYTMNAAYAAFQENLLGSLTAGKLADMVVLDQNIFEIPSEEIKDVKVRTTVWNGRIVKGS